MSFAGPTTNKLFMSTTLLPSIFIILLCLVCIVVFLAGLARVLEKTGWTPARRRSFFFRALLAIVLWLAVITLLSLSGFFKNFSFPPRVVIGLVVGFVLVMVVSSFRSF